MHILAHTHTSTHISYMRKFIVTLIRTNNSNCYYCYCGSWCSISRYFFPFLFLVFTCACTSTGPAFPGMPNTEGAHAQCLVAPCTAAYSALGVCHQHDASRSAQELPFCYASLTLIRCFGSAGRATFWQLTYLTSCSALMFFILWLAWPEKATVT